MSLVTEIVTQLSTTSMAQVLRPDAVGSTTVNGGVVVGDLITSHVSGRVYNLIMPDDASFPNAVFQLVSSKRDSVDGLPIIKTEKIILTLRDETLSALESVGNSVRGALLAYTSSGSAGAITIDDEAEDVEFAGDGLRKKYRLHLELTVTHLATTSQSLPAAFVYPLSISAFPPDAVNVAEQMIEDEAAVVIVEKSTGGSLDTALGHCDALIGYVPADWAIEYRGGELIRQDGHLTTWRERFSLKSFRNNE